MKIVWADFLSLTGEKDEYFQDVAANKLKLVIPTKKRQLYTEVTCNKAVLTIFSFVLSRNEWEEARRNGK